MTQTLSINEISIQIVIKLAKNGDEIVLEENCKTVIGMGESLIIQSNATA